MRHKFGKIGKKQDEKFSIWEINWNTTIHFTDTYKTVCLLFKKNAIEPVQRTFGTWNMEYIGVYRFKFNSILFHFIRSLCALSCVCVYKIVIIVVAVAAVALFADLWCSTVYCVRVCVQRGNETKCYKTTKSNFRWNKRKEGDVCMSETGMKFKTFVNQTKRIAQFSFIDNIVHENIQIFPLLSPFCFCLSTMYGCKV